MHGQNHIKEESYLIVDIIIFHHHHQYNESSGPQVPFPTLHFSQPTSVQTGPYFHFILFSSYDFHENRTVDVILYLRT
jgi:hypothetical protein